MLQLDYDIATLAGLPTCLLNCLQSVLNATAQSIAGFQRSDHIIGALVSFHLLWAPQRIKFKLVVIVYRALHGTAPWYLSDLLCNITDLPTGSLIPDFLTSAFPVTTNYPRDPS